jgi:beta-aspartyl-peptidase (threonine type)
MLARSIVGLCLLVAAAPRQAGDNEEAKASRKAIYHVLLSQIEAWNKGDLKGFMDGYLRSNELTFYSGGDVIKGWDAMMERYQKRYQGEGKEMGKLTFTEVDIELLGPGGAVVRGHWQLKMSKGNIGGLFTLILRQTKDGWRIVHDHTSQSPAN